MIHMAQRCGNTNISWITVGVTETVSSTASICSQSTFRQHSIMQGCGVCNVTVNAAVKAVLRNRVVASLSNRGKLDTAGLTHPASARAAAFIDLLKHIASPDHKIAMVKDISMLSYKPQHWGAYSLRVNDFSTSSSCSASCLSNLF